MKKYSCDQVKFNVSVTATGIFCLALLVASLLCIAGVLDVMPVALGLLVLLVSGYQVWNTFVSIANPQDVIIDDEGISFRAYGREDRYGFGDIHEFRVREVMGDGRMYVRVNGGGPLHGRYWIQTGYMNDGDELFRWIEDFEYQTDPNSLKARARRSSEAYGRAIRNRDGEPSTGFGPRSRPKSAAPSARRTDTE